MKIKTIKAFKTFDSRNKETIKVEIFLDDASVFAIAPNGTSKGKKEVLDFSINGVEYSISMIERIGREIINSNIKLEEFEDLRKIEEIISRYDSSENYKIIGGNAVYALEAALIKAIAKTRDIESWQVLREAKPRIVSRIIPMPLGNCIGGGKHTLTSTTEFQEFLITPQTKKFFEASFINQQAYKKTREIMQRLNKLSGVNIENALCASIDNKEALDLLVEVKEYIAESFGIKLNIGVDIAATNFYKGNVYVYKLKSLSASRQLDYINELINKYNLFYVEDPFYEDDFENFAKLTKMARKTIICGDDLICTNPKIIDIAIRKNATSGVIIKPNQVGSLIKTRETFTKAKNAGIKCVVSHRSGETIDDFIADLAVGWNADYIKTGIVGKEREAKLKRIIAIEKSIAGL